MQLFNVTLHQNYKFGSLRLDWLFKLKTHWVEEESERFICEIYKKTKFYKIYVVTVNKHTIKDQKLTTVLEVFSFLAMVN